MKLSISRKILQYCTLYECNYEGTVCTIFSRMKMKWRKLMWTWPYLHVWWSASTCCRSWRTYTHICANNNGLPKIMNSYVQLWPLLPLTNSIHSEKFVENVMVSDVICVMMIERCKINNARARICLESVRIPSETIHFSFIKLPYSDLLFETIATRDSFSVQISISINWQSGWTVSGNKLINWSQTIIYYIIHFKYLFSGVARVTMYVCMYLWKSNDAHAHT